MTQAPDLQQMVERECRHNFILITKSSYRETPYRLCSKCGRTLKEQSNEA